MWQWLHHAQHLAHVGLWLLKDALQRIAVKLTTRLEEFTWNGQASLLNDIKSFGFVMDIACHPLKDPCLRIPVEAANVEGSIELQQKLFIPMLFIGHKL